MSTPEQMKHRKRWLALATLILLMVAPACRQVEHVSPAVTSQTDQYEGAEASERQKVGDHSGDAPRPAPSESAEIFELAGMYGWNPEGGFHNAVWSGALVIDGPCVYLDVSHQDGWPVPEGEPLRSFVRLPEPRTRHGSATGEVWVGEHGPMSTGDEVVLVGSEGWQRHWNQASEDTHVFEFVWSNPVDPTAYAIPVCAAHVSFYAVSMSPPEDAEAVIDSEQGTHLSGLFPWDTQQGAADYGVQGVLTIEPPCVYLDNGERYLLRLARPLVRYDPETNSIWVDQNGPMTTGDEVITWGGGVSPFDESGPHARTCAAAGEVFSPALKPRDGTWID